MLSLFALTDLLQIKREQRLTMFLMSYIVLVMFSGLRYFPDQQDYAEYTHTFQEMTDSTLHFDSIFEPGYMLLMWIISRFSDNPTVFFTIVAAIGVGLNFAAIKRYMSQYVFLAILFYFVHTYIMREMGAIRAGISAGICFYWGLRYIEENKLIKYLMTTLIAMCFHLSAIAFFLVYPIYRQNWKPETMLKIVVSSAIIGTIMPLGRIIAVLPFVGSISRVAGYAQDITGALGIWTNPTTLKQLVFVISSLLFYKKIKESIPYFRIIIVPYSLSVCWLMLWNDFPIIAGRLAMFFSITEVVLIPCFIYVFAKHSRPIAMAILIVLAFFILYLNGITFLTPEMGYYPYRTIFSQ